MNTTLRSAISLFCPLNRGADDPLLGYRDRRYSVYYTLSSTHYTGIQVTSQKHSRAYTPIKCRYYVATSQLMQTADSYN